MRKQVLLLTSLLLAGGVLTAKAGVNKLVISSQTGVEEIELESINRITFNEEQMMVETQQGVSSYYVGDIDKMSFDLESGIDDVVSKEWDDGIAVAFNNGILTVTAADNSDIKLVVYAVNGMLVHSDSGNGTLVYDFTQLPEGIYIVRANNKTIKFVK